MSQRLTEVLRVWAADATCFIDANGQPTNVKTNAIAADVKRWLGDPDCEITCVETIKEARVKACLEELYAEQRRYGPPNATRQSRARVPSVWVFVPPRVFTAGTKHGLQRTTNVHNAVLWNYMPSSSVQASSAPFVRECRKLLFSHLDAGRDRDAARVVAELTPARNAELKPRSVLEVLDAVDGACAAAPPFSGLAAATRRVLRSKRQLLVGGAANASSPPARHVQKRGKAGGGRAELKFSPHLEVLSGGGVQPAARPLRPAGGGHPRIPRRQVRLGGGAA
jgi:hypothetical protein